jgi:hypothetical protein
VSEPGAARRLLSAVTAAMPAGRREWGRAMLAELDYVPGRRARWGFALGAVRAALAPPRRSTAAAAGLAAAAVAAGLVLHVVSPGTSRVSAAVALGLPALCARAALTQAGPPRPVSRAGRAAQVVAVLGIIACPVAAAVALAPYPGYAGPGSAAGRVTALAFAAELAGYLWLVLRRPGPLGAGRSGGLLGLAAAAGIAGTVAAAGPAAASAGPAATSAVLWAWLGAPVVAGLLAAGAGPGEWARSGIGGRAGAGARARSGIGEWAWGALLGGPAAFLAQVLTAPRAATAAAASRPATAAQAHQHGAQGSAGVLAWVAHGDLGAALSLLTALSAGGLLAVVLAWAATRPRASARPAPGARPG